MSSETEGWSINAAGNTVWSVANCSGTYAVWQVNGYTVLDLSKFVSSGGFNPATMPLLMTIRETLPNMQQPTPFNCSGAAVPFSTAEYTSGGGLMGPYVPQVDYVDPNTLAQTGPGVPTLPPTSACGSLPSGVTPGTNSPNTSSPLNWPEAYWPVSPSPYALSCGPKTLTSPQMNFVATQFPERISVWATGNSQDCTSSIQSNSCSQIALQAGQTTELPPPTYWYPGTPMTIIGTGFGYLPSPTLPLAASGSPYLLIGHCPSGITPCTQSSYDWDTNSTSCQMYITNWTDTSITVIPGLIPPGQDLYQYYDQRPTAYLSLLTDVSPFTFPAATACPVAAGDSFNFTVTNPQGGGTAPKPGDPPIIVPVTTPTNTALH